MKKNILIKISNKNLTIGIIGFGYVGMPLGVEFAKNGINVLAFEVDKEKIKNINKGISYVIDIKTEELKHLVNSKKIKATDNFSLLKTVDVIIVCVPTPLRKSKDPDVSYIINAGLEIKKNLKKGQIIILESTTYPGTTRDLFMPILEESSLKAGKDFFLAFSPERVDPGNKNFGIKNTTKVIGGIDKDSTELACKVYSLAIDKIYPVSNTETAEIVKLLENTFRAVNIAMINEMALMAKKLNLNIWEIIDAAKTKPFGFMPFYPGPGIGGHCIPLDPHYLGWKMKTLNFEPRFIELAGAINSSMPEKVIEELYKIMSDNKKPLKDSKILIIGIAYKPDISDPRESPAIDIISLLEKTGAKISYHDPYIEKIEISNKIYRSVNLNNVSKVDCVLIITNHSKINYDKIIKEAKIIFDTRNALKNHKGKGKIYKL